MAENEIQCSYTFTFEEYVTTQLLAKRLMPFYRKALMVFGLLLFTGVLIQILYDSRHLVLKENLSLLFFIVAYVFLVATYIPKLIPHRIFCSKRAFRRNLDIYNISLLNTVTLDGITAHTPKLAANINWMGIDRVRESPEGFAVYQNAGNYFIWFPKHAFLHPGDAERCREIFQENVKNFRIVK